MGTIRVLVVDDNLILNFAICETLKDRGFEVVGVSCAAAAFKAVDADSKLSALVTDVDLGTGPGGFDVARHARAAISHLLVVFISAMATARRGAEALEGARFIGKPLRPLEIAEVLQSASRQNAS